MAQRPVTSFFDGTTAGALRMALAAAGALAAALAAGALGVELSLLPLVWPVGDAASGHFGTSS